MEHAAPLFVLTLLLVYFLQRAVEYRRKLKDIDNFPGFRQVLSPNSVLAVARAWFKNAPPRSLAAGFSEFERFGWDAYTRVSVYPRTRTTVVLADPVAVKEVTTHRARFPKPVAQYAILALFGQNIVVTEGAEWKRYRRCSAPAFSERNNKLVWDETVGIVMDLMENVWGGASEVVVDDLLELTVPLALFVIGAAGFGRRISWKDDMKIPEGHQLTFKDAMQIVSTDIFLKLVLPRWALGLTARLRRVRTGFDELDDYMLEMIQKRRAEVKKEERDDLFSILLDAAEADSETQLSDRELVGNIFVFLVAGHETTAHTLCFALAYLALYPAEQDRLYAEVKRVIPDPAVAPTYEDMGSFTYTTAVLYETLRLMPPVTGIPKESAEDTVLVISNSRNETTSLPVPKGTPIVLHVPGMHHNPRYWTDPGAFKPARFLEDAWPRDAFVPFSAGPRACIGRKFAETEATAALAVLMAHYAVSVTPEARFAGETFEGRKARVLASKPGITTTPIRVPLTFTRRGRD